MDDQHKQDDIYGFITAEENAYNQGITIIDQYDWSMKEHIKLSNLAGYGPLNEFLGTCLQFYPRWL
jgi:hypothetical protein